MVNFSSFASGSIAGFDLKNCDANTCITLTTKKAVRNEIDSVFAFGRATLVLSKPKTSQLAQAQSSTDKVVTGENGYYDFEDGLIVLRNINGTQNEMVYNTNTGSINYF